MEIRENTTRSAGVINSKIGCSIKNEVAIYLVQPQPLTHPASERGHTSTTATLVSSLLRRRQTIIVLRPANTSGMPAHHRRPVVPHQFGSASVPVRDGTISNEAMNAHQDVQMRRNGTATAVPCANRRQCAFPAWDERDLQSVPAAPFSVTRIARRMAPQRQRAVARPTAVSYVEAS